MAESLVCTSSCVNRYQSFVGLEQARGYHDEQGHEAWFHRAHGVHFGGRQEGEALGFGKGGKVTHNGVQAVAPFEY